MVRALALGLAGASLAAALAVLGFAHVCGGMVTETTEPGAPMAEARCASNLQPVHLALAAAPLLGVAAVATGRASLALALGLGLTALAFPLIFSVGLYLFPIGVLLANAGLAAAAPDAAGLRRGLPEALAVVGLALGGFVVWLAGTLHPLLLVTPALAALSAGAILLRARWAALGGALALLFAGIAIMPSGFPTLLTAGLMLTAAHARWRSLAPPLLPPPPRTVPRVLEPLLTLPGGLATFGMLLAVAALAGLAAARALPAGWTWAQVAVAPALAVLAWAAVVAGARLPALALALLAVAWGLVRFPSNALGDVPPAAFLLAGALLAWLRAPRPADAGA